jgi:hypothetical protein
MDNKVLVFFESSNGLTPKQFSEYEKHALNRGICLGTSMQHLSGKNYNQPHIRLLQASSHTNLLLGQKRPFLPEIGKKILGLPDSSLIKKRMEEIFHKSFKNVSLDNAFCFYVGATAYRFYRNAGKNNVESPLYKEIESEVFTNLGIAKNHISTTVPEALLKRDNLSQGISIIKEKSLKEFLSATEHLDKGLYCIALFSNTEAHAISFSLNDLTFCDANDVNPDDLKPYVHKFQSKKELLDHLNAHMAIFYKPHEFTSFDLKQFNHLVESSAND